MKRIKIDHEEATARIHSPSSLALGKQCRRAWALRYLDHIKEPELDWDDIASGKVKAYGKQRSAALGKKVHTYAEYYLTGLVEKIDWHSLPGEVLQTMTPHLPPEGSVPPGCVEREFVIMLDGMRIKGVIDVEGYSGKRGRLWPDAPGEAEVWDHKTTRSIIDWAKLPHEVAIEMGQPERSLRDDLQACTYVLRRHSEAPHLTEVECHWTYGETDKVRRSLPVLEVIPVKHARSIVRKAAEIAPELEGYETSADAPPSPLACDDYGGCWYRREGYCHAKRPWGLIMRLEAEAEGKKASK